jgi:RNA polymerase sigma-70 factor, ECF subfamily
MDRSPRYVGSRVNTTEEQLVARARHGDTAAFETLVRLHERYVFNLALRVVGDPDEAEDLAQQAFIRAWRALPDFRGEARFGTWLYRIVTNLCYNRLPRLKRELANLTTDDEAFSIPDERQELESSLITTGLRRCLHQAFDALPQGYRLLLSLRHLQELSYDEIALITGMPLGTVKTGIFRARRMLRETLEKYEAHYG